MKINLRPLHQEGQASCLPACLRMVLDYFGITSTEEALAKACGTNKEGTELKEAAQALRLQNFTVLELKEADLFELVDHLNRGRPVIAALDAEQLSYANSGTHAVVINGIEKNRIYCVDPALGRKVSLDLITFFKAWDACACSGLVLYPKSKIRKKKK